VKEGTLDENSPLAPINPYAVSKTAIDLYVQERIRNNFMNGFVTRAFSHTGPRRGFNFSISSDAYQIAKMMLGLQDKVLLIGNLETKRVVIDVRDCVNAYYLLMMKEDAKDVYNICGENVHKMQYFTDVLIGLSGLKNIEQRIYKPFYRSIDIEVQISNTYKLRNATGRMWSPVISIEETLDNLLQYWVNKIKNEKEN
jgi:GDPmannose 4,6-dehydratase